jgi:hypothetical protein
MQAKLCMVSFMVRDHYLGQHGREISKIDQREICCEKMKRTELDIDALLILIYDRLACRILFSYYKSLFVASTTF